MCGKVCLCVHIYTTPVHKYRNVGTQCVQMKDTIVTDDCNLHGLYTTPCTYVPGLYTTPCTYVHGLYTTPCTCLYTTPCTHVHGLYTTPCTCLYTTPCTHVHGLYTTPCTYVHGLYTTCTLPHVIGTWQGINWNS